LHWYQQTIQHRSQSNAFLERQSLFQELNGAVAFALQSVIATPWSTLSITSDFPLPSTTFPSEFSPWSGATSPLSNGHLDLRLNYQKESIDLDFSIFLFHRQLSLTEIPWMTFQTYHMNFPDKLKLSAEDSALVQTFSHVYWLPEESSGTSFTHTLPANSTILLDNNTWYVVNGPTIPLDQGKSVQIQGDATFLFANNASAFSLENAVLTAKILGTMTLQGNSGVIHSGQINGYFHIQGDTCLQFSQITEVFWKGSIACDYSPSFESMIQLKHETPAEEVPTLNRHVIQFDGVQLDVD